MAPTSYQWGPMTVLPPNQKFWPATRPHTVVVNTLHEPLVWSHLNSWCLPREVVQGERLLGVLVLHMRSELGPVGLLLTTRSQLHHI